MAEVGSLFIRLRADASEFENTMSGLGGQLDNAGGKMQSAGGGLTKNVTAPLLGIGTAAVAVGMGFDDQMAKVQAISGTTGQDFDTLRGTAKELGSTTRFSATEAAEGLEYLALAGWDANEMASGLGGVLDLASASGMDLGRTSDIVTDTMSAFGISAEDSGKVADMFATTSSNANTNVEQLGGALGKAGPILSSMGMDLDESQAALGMMADQGLKGSRAGTALGAVMRDLAGNAEDGTVSFGDFDVALYDAQGNMRPFGDILGDLEGGLEGMSDEQRNAALSTVFQQQSLQGINPLLSEGADRYEELRGGIETSEGAAQTMSETMESTLGGSFRALRSQVEGVLIQLSDVLAPIMRDQVMPLIEQLAGFIGNLIERFTDLDPNLQMIILGALGLLAAIGPLLVILGTAVKVVGMMAVGLGLLASPVVLVIAGIAALVAGLIYAYTQFETFRNIVDTVAGFIRDVVVEVWDRISGRLREFGETVIPEVIETWNVLKGAVETAVNFIWDNVIQPIFSAIQGFIEDHSDTIESVLTGVWEIIESTISTAVDVIEGVIVAALALIRGDWDEAWEAVKGVADSVWEHIETVFTNVKDFLVETWDTIRSTVVKTVEGWYDDVTSKVSEMIDSVMETIGELPGKILDFFKDAGTWLIDAGKDIIGGLISGIGDAIPGVGGALSGARDYLPFSPAKTGPLRDITKDPEGVLSPVGEELMGGLASGVSRGLSDLNRGLASISLENRATFAGVGTGRAVTVNVQPGAVQIDGAGDGSLTRQIEEAFEQLAEDIVVAGLRSEPGSPSRMPGAS